MAEINGRYYTNIFIFLFLYEWMYFDSDSTQICYTVSNLQWVVISWDRDCSKKLHSWRIRSMETLSVLPALLGRESTVIGSFPSHRASDVEFCGFRWCNKLSNKQSSYLQFEMPFRSCDVTSVFVLEQEDSFVESHHQCAECWRPRTVQVNVSPWQTRLWS